MSATDPEPVRPNALDPAWDEERVHPRIDGYRARRARVGRAAGARRLGASVFEIGPGQAAYPYHLHLGEEELLVVLAGRPHLRTPNGWRRLAEGEVVAFPRGEAGAHQLVNRGEQTVRFLTVSTNGDPDVVVYPDEGKVGLAERPPEGEGGLWLFFAEAEARPYWDGIEAPSGPDDGSGTTDGTAVSSPTGPA